MNTNTNTMNARAKVEQSGRAPILGWAQDRRIDLFSTDVRSTFKAIQERMQQTTQGAMK